MRAASDGRQGNAMTDVRDEVWLPLTTAQRGLWMNHKIGGADGAIMNIAEAVDIHGPVDPQVFRQALYRLVYEAQMMRANVVEAAEQCGILSIAAVGEPVPLERYLGQRPADRLLIFCDEAAEVQSPVQSLQRASEAGQGIDVLIGPEGGFADEERALLLKQPKILRLALGPRIMRADTAAVAALALVQAVLGDWAGQNG